MIITRLNYDDFTSPLKTQIVTHYGLLLAKQPSRRVSGLHTRAFVGSPVVHIYLQGPLEYRSKTRWKDVVKNEISQFECKIKLVRDSEV